MMQIILQSRSQGASPLSVNNAHRLYSGKNCLIQVFIYRIPCVLAVHTAHIDLWPEIPGHGMTAPRSGTRARMLRGIGLDFPYIPFQQANTIQRYFGRENAGPYTDMTGTVGQFLHPSGLTEVR